MRSNFQSHIWWYFIVDLLMQHQIHCVNLIGWSTCKNEPDNSHIHWNPSSMPKILAEAKKARDPCQDKSDIFPGHITSAKGNSSWRRLLPNMCAHNCLPFLNHLNVVVNNLLDCCLPISKQLCVVATDLLGSHFRLVARDRYPQVGSSCLQLALPPHCLHGYMTQQPLIDCFFSELPVPPINRIGKNRSCSSLAFQGASKATGRQITVMCLRL